MRVAGDLTDLLDCANNPEKAAATGSKQ